MCMYVRMQGCVRCVFAECSPVAVNYANLVSQFVVIQLHEWLLTSRNIQTIPLIGNRLPVVVGDENT